MVPDAAAVSDEGQSSGNKRKTAVGRIFSDIWALLPSQFEKLEGDDTELTSGYFELWRYGTRKLTSEYADQARLNNFSQRL